MEDPFRNQTWEDVLDRLKRGQVPPDQIGRAIVRVGKPFDQAKILAAKDTVALYLNHSDSWVRHEAMWFLTSWGRLKEYQPALIHALLTDDDLDSRCYAATCLGRLCEGTNAGEVVAALKTTVENNDIDDLVRLCAYGALLQVVKGTSDLGFWPHEHKLSDVDWKWLSSLQVPDQLA